MNKVRRWAAVTVAVMLAASGVRAQTLEFRQCVETALAQNPDLSISHARIDQAQAGLREARGNRMPRLNLSLTGTRSNDALNAFGMKLGQRNATFNDFGAGEFTGPGALGVTPQNLNHPDAVNNFNSRIELQVPVYNGGMVRAYIDTAKAYVRAAQSGDEAARQQLIKNVLMAYQGVHTARAYIQVAQEARAAAEEYVRITEKLHKQGMVVKSDLLTARVNLEDVKVKLIEARDEEKSALNQLALLLGLPMDAPLEVGAAVMPGLQAGSDAELRQQASAGNAGLRALRAQVEATGAQVGVARAGKKPQFNVLLRQDWNDKDLGLTAPAYTVAGVLSWTAFDGGVTNAGVDRAEAARSEWRAKLRQAEAGIAYQVTDAQRRALEAQERETARTANLNQAQEALRRVRKRYESGMGTMVELLAAQAQLEQAGADLVAARYELAVNRTELKRAVGVLTVDTL